MKWFAKNSMWIVVMIGAARMSWEFTLGVLLATCACIAIDWADGKFE